MTDKTNILILCTGNTCRSPMAAYLLWDMLEKRGIADHFQIESAGLAAYEGDPINPNAQAALLERGIDAAGHRAKQLNKELLREADIIYVMTESHAAAIAATLPDAAKKLRILHISDPYGGDLERYRNCLQEIEACFQHEALFSKGEDTPK